MSRKLHPIIIIKKENIEIENRFLVTRKHALSWSGSNRLNGKWQRELKGTHSWITEEEKTQIKNICEYLAEKFGFVLKWFVIRVEKEIYCHAPHIFTKRLCIVSIILGTACLFFIKFLSLHELDLVYWHYLCQSIILIMKYRIRQIKGNKFYYFGLESEHFKNSVKLLNMYFLKENSFW